MTSVPIRPRFSTRPVAWLRGRFRSSEAWFIALAIAVGTVAGLLAVVQSTLAHGLQVMLFGLNFDDRLSAAVAISPWRLAWLPIGGLLLGSLGQVLGRFRTHPVVDVVEANALHGGSMSLRGSLVICVQTLISNGFGASVGLEAAYAQAGGGFASALGRRLRLRRNDLRTLVGAGAGAAIGAAFGAPLTGAFYAFEVVIGSYAPSMIAPVAAAALAAVLAAQALGSAPYSIHVAVFHSPDAVDFILYAGLGGLCAALSVALMQAVAGGEKLVNRLPMPPWLRTVVGGGLLALLAFLSPQTLSSGHGALHADLSGGITLKLLLLVLALKAAASIVSLASGFRGGLFFASLFLGSLVGQIYARLAALIAIPIVLQPENAALVGMGAFATAVVGGPLTMSFLVLETTRDFGVAAATLAASLVASSIVRERFGYSFSTWRLHLRGETIRSARDVGWVRTLTAGRMMRTDVPTLSATATLAEFRRRFPLGSSTRVILIDDAQHYAGIVVTASAYADDRKDEDSVGALAVNQDVTLTPEMNIEQVMQIFETTETEDLPVVDAEGEVLGLLAEVYVVRRYAKELETVQQGLFGESWGRV
jgi:chloride channel protein, CIC family